MVDHEDLREQALEAGFDLLVVDEAHHLMWSEEDGGNDRYDLVEELAARFSQLTQRDAEFAVKAILDAMNDALVRGHRIEIRGFGSFSVNYRAPRMGRNPRSGESVAIPEKRVPHFKPGKALREAVDQRTAELTQTANG